MEQIAGIVFREDGTVDCAAVRAAYQAGLAKAGGGKMGKHIRAAEAMRPHVTVDSLRGLVGRRREGITPVRAGVIVSWSLDQGILPSTDSTLLHEG